MANHALPSTDLLKVRFGKKVCKEKILLVLRNGVQQKNLGGLDDFSY